MPPRKINLSRRIEKNLPLELIDMVHASAALADKQNEPLYLVGGVVRDLFLGRPNFDLDFVVEGDAIALAEAMASKVGGKLTAHRRFNTAKLRLAGWNLDFAMARAETYARPGALPAVMPGSLMDDLFRRDFTINAMAVRVSPETYGELIDLYGGRDDLKAGLIRVLHERSFTDDATRIWRAVRYEQRLGFHIEPVTLRLLRRDVPMLDTISGDRIRHELELVLKENWPEDILARAWKLKVLGRIHPSLKGDAWLGHKFAQAGTMLRGQVLNAIRWALLTYRLNGQELEDVITFLRPERKLATILCDVNQMKTELKPLAAANASRSYIYSLLQGRDCAALLTHLVANGSSRVRSATDLYLEKLRFIRPLLTGAGLLQIGVLAGPQVQEVLTALQNARLDGKINSRVQEEALVKLLLK